MLNELESIRRGLTNGGIEFGREHPRVKLVGGRRRPVLIRLDRDGQLADIELIPDTLAGSLWTFQDGQHNSFPFVSLPPLLDLHGPAREDFNQNWKKNLKSKPAVRRQELLRVACTYQGADRWLDDWPGRGLLDSLRTKHNALAKIEAQASAVPEAICRFLTTFSSDGDAIRKRRKFISALRTAMLREIEEGIDEWLEVARAALVGEEKSIGRKKKLVGADFYFDVAPRQFDRDVHDPRNRAAAALAFSAVDTTDTGRCAISGKVVELSRGTFPQPTLPGLGRTYLFSKNSDLPATGSYHRFDTDGFSIGRLLAEEMAGAITELISEPRKNVTWCTVPGEKRGTTDLLIAFVEGAPNAPATGVFAGDDDDESDELDPVAVYERRTERLIEAVKGKADEDFRRTPVQACLLRKVDEGNRKALLHRHLNVGQLYDHARAWGEAQRNLPAWLFLLHRKRRRRPQSLTPLSIPALTKRQFVRDGTEVKEAKGSPIGLPATEVFGLFLREGDTLRLARRFLNFVLKRDQQLLEAAGHFKYGGRVSRLDAGAALRVLTLLAILLHALGRRGGEWMNEAAFRLGQLLSVADVVHAGYCADVRQGQVPPALLGNAVLAMAQANPSKAIAVLARRWPPYASWAKRASAAEARGLRDSKNQDERDRGWKISQAIWQHRRAAEISAALHGQLPQKADDVFRAELLLGYVAGLPPVARTESGEEEQGRESDAEGEI